MSNVNVLRDSNFVEYEGIKLTPGFVIVIVIVIVIECMSMWFIRSVHPCTALYKYIPVHHPSTLDLADAQVTLTDRELEVIRRIQAGAFPHPEFEAHSDYVDYVTHEKEIMPLNGGDIPKRRFVPSKVW